MNEREFQKFLKSYEAPRQDLDLRVLAEAHKQSAKERAAVVTKALLIHAGAGLATLAVCPQFGWSPFDAPERLPHLFMSYGVWACGLFCGAVFMGAGTFIKMLFMRPNELKTYQRKAWAYSSWFSALFLGTLMLLGLDNAQESAYLSALFIAFWYAGAWLFEAAPNAALFWLKSRGRGLAKSGEF